MGVFLGEKLIQAALTSGLATIKGDLDTYLPIIFPVVGSTDNYANIFEKLGLTLSGEETNTEFAKTIKSFLTSKRIDVKQGFPLTQSKYPGFYVSPASIEPFDKWIGSYVFDEVDGDNINEYSGILNSQNIRVLSTSDNGDVTLFLDMLVRYILLSAMEGLATSYSLSDFSVSTNNFDPIVQYLPEQHFYKTTMVSFNVIDSWVQNFPVVQDVESYLTSSREVVA
jgi:hypothetical protein